MCADLADSIDEVLTPRGVPGGAHQPDAIRRCQALPETVTRTPRSSSAMSDCEDCITCYGVLLDPTPMWQSRQHSPPVGVGMVAIGGSAPPFTTQGWAASSARPMRASRVLTNTWHSSSFSGWLTGTLEGNR